jgi:hypothetical protein
MSTIFLIGGFVCLVVGIARSTQKVSWGWAVATLILLGAGLALQGDSVGASMPTVDVKSGWDVIAWAFGK